MVWPAWVAHEWTGRYGVSSSTLAIVNIGGNVRLHLWFTARTYPQQLPSQLANISRLVRAADVAFSLIMVATGLVIADAHTGWSALLVSFGLGGALAFLVIEPATARAAFGPQSKINLKSESGSQNLRMAVWDDSSASNGTRRSGSPATCNSGATARRLTSTCRRSRRPRRWEAELMISRSELNGTRWLMLQCSLPRRAQGMGSARDVRARPARCRRWRFT
jgi:hypothetical protein